MSISIPRLKPWHWLALLGLLAVGFRLIFLPLIENPGLNDPIHYYNLGRRLLAGEGFTIDYVWHYHYEHADIVHPIDHWMPLTGVLVALGMAVGGVNIAAALLPLLALSACLPAIVYQGARQAGVPVATSLLTAGLAIPLPDFVLNSLRPDTTLPNMIFVSGSLIALVQARQSGRARWFVAGGVLGGLAYLTRNDALLLLPMWAASTALVALWPGERPRWRWAALAYPLVMLAVMGPWLARNQATLGLWGSPEAGKMFFMTDNRQHYSYDEPITFETMLAVATPADLLAKRAFELLAAIKQMIVTLEGGLVILVAGGLLLLLSQRQRQPLLAVAPALILLGGTLFVYPILIPFKSQSGSFEKAYLAIVPALLPLAGVALERAVPAWHLRAGVVGLLALVLAFFSIDTVRQDVQVATRYYGFIERMVEASADLPDLNGDGEIRLMTQDPYVLSYYGVRSVMTPFTSRDKTLEVARRYRIDYLLMPSARPALDPIHLGEDSDARIVPAVDIDAGTGTPHRLYALYPEGAP